MAGKEWTKKNRLRTVGLVERDNRGRNSAVLDTAVRRFSQVATARIP
jgi:hypothetical protein